MRLLTLDWQGSSTILKMAEEPIQLTVLLSISIVFILNNRWMAPESLTHQVYFPKSDVFSFGVVLYEIATQSDPWPGVNLSIFFQYNSNYSLCCYKSVCRRKNANS